MDLIILQDGLYYLVPITVDLLIGEVWKDCFDLCNIVRKKIALHDFQVNMHIIKDGTFYREMPEARFGRWLYTY